MRDRLRSSRAQMITILIFEASTATFFVGGAAKRQDPAELFRREIFITPLLDSERACANCLRTLS